MKQSLSCLGTTPYYHLEARQQSEFVKFTNGFKAKVEHYKSVDFAKGRSFEGRSWYKPYSAPQPSRCLDREMTYFNYGKQGHMARDYTLSKKERFSTKRSSQASRAKIIEKVFALSGAKVSGFNSLIQGICLLHGYFLIVLFNFGTTHSFISHVCASTLKLLVSLHPMSVCNYL
ncbi:hypothetical protein CR513_19883, partial [Mucuna pruriens]